MNTTKKKSFLVAVVCLILCVALLVGTTFAWFTDSVSNTGNRIQAGTLDIDLLMYKSSQQTTPGYVSIAGGSGDIFKEATVAQNSNETLWEPGKTQVVYLGIQNKGNLALKYKTVIDVTDNGLVGSLEYALFEGTYDEISPYFSGSSWETVKAAAGLNTGDVEAGRTVISTGVLDEITGGEPDETDYVALAVHMKEDAGNEYQDKDITIDLNILAAQLNAELDGFGSSDYDKDAMYPSVAAPVINEQEEEQIVNAGEAVEIESDNCSSTIKAAGETSGIQIKTSAKTDDPLVEKNEYAMASGSSLERTIKTTAVTGTSVTYDISYIYTETVGEVSTSYNVSEFAGVVTNVVSLKAGLEDVSVTHSHGGTTTPMTEAATAADEGKDGYYKYDSSTGILTIWSTLYSEFSISYKTVDVAKIGTQAYASLGEAVANAEDGDTIEVLADCPGENMIDVTKNLTINGNGYTVTFTDPSTSYGFCADADGDKTTSAFTVTYNDVNVKSKGPGFYAGESKYANVVLNNCTVVQGTLEDIPEYCRTALAAACGGTMTVNGGTFTASNYGAYVFTSGGTINLNNAKVTATTAALKCDSYSSTRLSLINVASGTYSGKTDLSNNWSGGSGGSNSEIRISGGTFTSFGWSSEPKQYGWLEHVKLVITGGNFDVDPTENVANGYKAVKMTGTTSDTWAVIKVAAEINGTYYETFQDALANVKAGETIKLLENAEINGIENILNQDFSVTSGNKFVQNDYGSKTSSGEYYIKDTATGLRYYNGGKQLYINSAFTGENLYIPEGVEELVGMKSACTAANLKNVYFPTTIKRINGREFHNCTKLEKIYYKSGAGYVEGLPQTLEYIGESAFQSCTNLSTPIVIPDAITGVKAGAFYETGITSVTFNENITGIEAGAFRNCVNLTEVHLPASITTLGKAVFRDCSNLTKIYFDFETVPQSFDTFSFASVSAMFNNTAKRTIYVKNQAVADAVWEKLDSAAKANYTIRNADNESIVYYPAPV